MSVLVNIDPNVRVENGWTYAGFEDIKGGVVRVGDSVHVAVDETGLVGVARIESADWDKRLIFLDVQWDSLRQKHDS